MKLLNLGCGGNRLPEPWLNVDSLYSQLLPGTPERTNLNRENNYIDCNLSCGIPFANDSVDGILASHLVEHFDAQKAWKLIRECRRVLRIGGLLLVSVPNTSYFRKVYHEDNRANTQRLFGETLDSGNPHQSFFDCALFFNEHLQVLTEDSLWAIMVKGGFAPKHVHLHPLDIDYDTANVPVNTDVWRILNRELNRPLFSLVMWGVKV